MRLELQNGFYKRLKGRIGAYEFELGQETSKAYKLPAAKDSGITNLYGGPARKTTAKVGEGINLNRAQAELLFLGPFKKRNSEIIRFAQEYLKMVFRNGQQKTVTNLLQAVVRNPILKGQYGSNKPGTVAIKGFDRRFIDTGWFFKSIKARILKRRV